MSQSPVPFSAPVATWSKTNKGNPHHGCQQLFYISTGEKFHMQFLLSVCLHQPFSSSLPSCERGLSLREIWQLSQKYYSGVESIYGKILGIFVTPLSQPFSPSPPLFFKQQICSPIHDWIHFSQHRHRSLMSRHWTSDRMFSSIDPPCFKHKKTLQGPFKSRSSNICL